MSDSENECIMGEGYTIVEEVGTMEVNLQSGGRLLTEWMECCILMILTGLTLDFPHPREVSISVARMDGCRGRDEGRSMRGGEAWRILCQMSHTGTLPPVTRRCECSAGGVRQQPGCPPQSVPFSLLPYNSIRESLHPQPTDYQLNSLPLTVSDGMSACTSFASGCILHGFFFFLLF